MSKRSRRRRKEKSKRQNGQNVTVYRGTRRVQELELFFETDGYVLSSAAQDGYRTYAFDGYEFRDAWLAGTRLSDSVLKVALSTWGGPADYSEAHAVFGEDLTKEFGKRPAISWTTNVSTAENFAGTDGYVLSAQIGLSTPLNPHWGTNDESEVLVANGVWASVFRWPKNSSR